MGKYFNTDETDEPPRRFKNVDELTPEELLEVKRARKRGKAEPKFETPEYQERRAEVLREAGLNEEVDEKPLGELSTAEHFARRRRA